VLQQVRVFGGTGEPYIRQLLVKCVGQRAHSTRLFDRQKQPTGKRRLNQQKGRGLSWQMPYTRMRRGWDLPVLPGHTEEEEVIPLLTVIPSW
jgi:hypothetical protein